MEQNEERPFCIVSRDSYNLFDDQEWTYLLRSRGVDLTRAIRYRVAKYGVSIFYDDTFIGEGI